MTDRIGRDAPQLDGGPGTLLNESGKGPWGNEGGGAGKSGGRGGGLGPRNPWRQPPGGPRGPRPAAPAALDRLLRSGRSRLGGHLPGTSGPMLAVWGTLALVLGWLVSTGVHPVDVGERGVVTRLGAYQRILPPGIGFTLPAPFESVQRVPVDREQVAEFGAAAANAQELMVTGDRSLLAMAFSVRWQVSDPARYLFGLADPEQAVRSTAEGTMRSAVAASRFDTVMTAPGPLAERVVKRMQAVLDAQGAGVRVTGLSIRRAGPPAAVTEVVKQIQSAQQSAQASLAAARTDAQRQVAIAEAEADAFDKVYAQYRLAPEITRQRLYYETMEEVLGRTDKVIVETPGVSPLLPIPPGRRAGGQP